MNTWYLALTYSPPPSFSEYRNIFSLEKKFLPNRIFFPESEGGVPSARAGLTTLFGMGRGVPPRLKTPGTLCSKKKRVKGTCGRAKRPDRQPKHKKRIWNILVLLGSPLTGHPPEAYQPRLLRGYSPIPILVPRKMRKFSESARKKKNARRNSTFQKRKWLCFSFSLISALQKPK